MEQPEHVLYPSEEMMVRLIEEQLWCGYEGIESSVGLHLDDENATYLRESLFPTLIPALHDLVRREQHRISEPLAFQERFQATGNTHPVTWLAQYLLRNNTHHSTNLRSHPYVLVNNEVLRKQKETIKVRDFRDI
ncbi:hypothetical protein Tc00.1047053506425.20 [Trypanosoma cruzi]|uniref:Uncharacterized protein n=1 Tax=Trypanosoma cruzi (strain CL Brener) TaxID=353153 RepID=Q4DM55_TRYCC|nr:hypothetical protein Tc00.1047053506425.20 [Trypanosoma cruzi]EAN93593.1 hypothetical protein Tc00.1047053506425.20 [Trypanosoma cruzi]|eukprot:XP_815444.1 hypothetical protein [Trypanosoma cruzi strain CL Brener]